jgi:hypothetical protein
MGFNARKKRESCQYLGEGGRFAPRASNVAGEDSQLVWEQGGPIGEVAGGRHFDQDLPAATNV